MTETNRIEFKERLTRDLDIEKEVIAFLNYHEGGILYIGIDKNGKAVGVEDIDGDMLRIKDRLRQNISPSPLGLFDVTTESIDGVFVIKIFVASGSEKPYFKTSYGLSPKGCYLRVGTAAEPMTQNMIDELFAGRVRNSLRNIVSPRQDLTFQQLQIYYQTKGFTLNDNFHKSLDLLTTDGKYNYVAYLLADENSNSIKFARYVGTDRDELASNKEFGNCCLLTATQKVLDKLDVENKVKSKIGYPFREDTPQWNERAVRELVINAMVHNDYTNEVPPKFELFSDHLEITSAGHLPVGMSKDDFFGGVSYPRNKELMRVFRDAEMVESLGSGLPRVLKVYGRESFHFMDNFIRVSIPYSWVENDTKDDTKDDTKELTEQQQLILSLIAQDGTITRGDLAQKIGVSDSTVARELQALVANGYLVRVGGRKQGVWKVL